jgi:multicomponent Na+:H+ antiporter subunit G
MEWIGLIAVWIGVIFCALGVIGQFRFSDVYSRLHASGKVSTLGLAGLLLGAALILPSTGGKALALAIFMVITSPIGTHAIALAAYRHGVALRNSKRDDLASRIKGSEGDSRLP